MHLKKLTLRINCLQRFYVKQHLIPFFPKRRGKRGWGGGRGICRWMGTEDFQNGTSRFWEKYGRETVFPTLDGAGNY